MTQDSAAYEGGATRASGARGRFVTFEGIDGAGKSSHIAWFAQRLRQRGQIVLETREPGGTPLGERLRQLLLTEPMSLQTECLLMFAARQEHLIQLIRPALERGEWVVCDRFTDATYAYQGGGRQLGSERVEALERWVHPDLQPHRTYLFDLPPAEAERRRALAREADRFEREQLAFFERVRCAYLERHALDPERIRLIDASATVDEIRVILEKDIASI